MTQEWHELTDLLGDRDFVVTGVRLKGTDTRIEGEFEMPPLQRLSYEDQVFVGEFVRAHGSIKHMEKAFGVSYPTIKNRLNRIAAQLELVRIDVEPTTEARQEVLDLLDRGEISAEEAAEEAQAIGMILPPLIIDVHVRREGSRDYRVWLPFFLLWLVLLPLVIFVLLVTVLVDFVLLLAGARYHHYTALAVGVLQLLAETRGTKADIVSEGALVHVVII